MRLEAGSTLSLINTSYGAGRDTAILVDAHVLFNGGLCKGREWAITEASEEGGYIVRYALDEEGNFAIEGGEIKTERLYGKVTLLFSQKGNDTLLALLPKAKEKDDKPAAPPSRAVEF